MEIRKEPNKTLRPYVLISHKSAPSGSSVIAYPNARRFYQIMAIGAVIIIFSLVPTNLLRTEGLATEAMIGSVAGTIVTICCDPLFIFGFHMGAAGAAGATVLGYVVTDLLYLYYVIHRCQVITVDPRQLRVTWKWVKEVIVIGIPASLTNLMQIGRASCRERVLAIV